MDYFNWNERRLISRRAILGAAMAIPLVGTGMALAATSDDKSDKSDKTPEAGAPGAGTPAAGTAVASPTAVVEVQMGDDLRFHPEELTISVGDTVRWVNSSDMPHSATGDPDQNPVNSTNPEYVALPDGANPWGSKILQPGEEYEHTFTVPGTYKYICIPHVLSGMRGEIVVKPGDATPTSA